MAVASTPHFWSRADWVHWRDRSIDSLLTPSYDSNGRPFLDREKVIAKCADLSNFLTDNLQESIPELDHFRAFVSAQGLYTTHKLGFLQTDRSYWSANSGLLAFPSLLRSPSFLAALDDGSAASFLASREPSWVVFTYRSQFILSADSTTYGRVLIFVPDEAQPDGSRVDRWIQFAVPVAGERPGTVPRSVSMIAVHRVNGRSEIRLMDFMRTSDGFRPNVLMASSPSNGCYDCHKVGVIPIYPKSGPAPSPLNSRIASYGRCDFGDLPVSGYGPGLGTPAPASDRIGRYMNCGACHDGIGSINYLAAAPSSRDTGAFEAKKGLVQSFIEQGIMPPGNDLSPSEREELYRRLTSDYLDVEHGTGKLVAWLKG